MLGGDRAGACGRRGVHNLLTVLCWATCVMGVAGPASAELGKKTSVFPHLKVMMIAYANVYTPEQLAFMGTHYDAFIGNGEAVGDAPSFTYTNYYCMYVGKEEYKDAQAWAEAHGADFESFFLHYSEATACHPYAGVTYTLPAGSRVPTYQWYDTGGDMTKTGARVVMNVGSADYRAWKMDYVTRQLQKTGADGVFVDNTAFTFMPGNFTVTSGGAIAEYPANFIASYATDLLKVFEGFHTKFGEEKGQLANMGLGDDPRVYPYLWGIFREGMNQPGGLPSFALIDKALSASTAAGVKANLIGSYWPDARWDMAALAFHYVVSNETCYFMPFLQYVSDEFASDPRKNQWYDAVAYDIGAPKGPRGVLQAGIDPAASRDTLSATVTKSTTYIYRLTDSTKAWTDKQWNNAWVVFPSGFTMRVYKSGTNWVELYSPGEVPTDGKYQVGASTYSVLSREYGKALVLFRPKMEARSDTGEASAVTVELPATADNPSGRYYLLQRDGTLEGTPRTSISLRNTDGAILVKASCNRAPVSFSDAPTDFWAHDAILAVAEAGIVTGYDDGTYDPDGVVTRDQMAVYMARALAGGDAAVPTAPAMATFPDVPADFWAFKYIEYAEARGIVQGYRDGYHPGDPVNRGQMAAYVARAVVGGDAGVPEGPATPTFPDVPANFWAYKYVEYCYAQGIVAGYVDGYHPERIVTRDQMAVYVTRAFQLTI